MHVLIRKLQGYSTDSPNKYFNNPVFHQDLHFLIYKYLEMDYYDSRWSILDILFFMIAHIADLNHVSQIVAPHMSLHWLKVGNKQKGLR